MSQNANYNKKTFNETEFCKFLTQNLRKIKKSQILQPFALKFSKNFQPQKDKKGLKNAFRCAIMRLLIL